jgi:hypothetical protein
MKRRLVDLIEWLDQSLSRITVAAFTSVIAAVGWLIRRIFTNQKQIQIQQQELELLKAEIEARDQLRAQDVQVMTELRQDIRDLRAFIQQIYQQERHRGQP